MNCNATKTNNIDSSYAVRFTTDLLNKNIKVLDLFDYLSIQLNNNPKIDLYYQEDSHYSLNGQKIVSDIISEYLKTIN